MNKEILELCGLTKGFEGIKAVDGISLAFSRGKITSLIGPNGAGKTTIFNLINGFVKPDSGAIFFNGKRIDMLPPWKVAALGIGRIFQDVRIFGKLTALENLLLAARNGLREHPIKVLLFKRRVSLQEKNLIELARKWLGFVELGGKENTLAENLSYGQQKLLAIARLLMGGYQLLLLDEPTAGVNPTMAKDILNVIKRLVREQEDRTAIIIEHNMTAVLHVSDWVFFMDEGKITSFGLPDDVLRDPEVRRAYLGL